MAVDDALNEYLTAQLPLHRPDRYDQDAIWLADLVDEIPDGIIAPEEAKRILLLERAQQVDKQARRRGNTLMKRYGEISQLSMIDWRPMINDPIFVEQTRVVNGAIATTREYVTIRAATPSDLIAWAERKREIADRNHRAEEVGIAGAQQMATDMRKDGADRFSDWVKNLGTWPAA